jgi:acyl-CoA thioester hydrolase
MTHYASDTPYRGHFSGKDHHFAVHIYFEDTDFSGLVYHANYLRYMERARSDMLACAGINQKESWATDTGVYAVADLSIKYVRPAHFGDDLLVVTRLIHIGAASVKMRQEIFRGEEKITDAQVTAAFLSATGRPKRQPKPWIDAFSKLRMEPCP